MSTAIIRDITKPVVVSPNSVTNIDLWIRFGYS